MRKNTRIRPVAVFLAAMLLLPMFGCAPRVPDDLYSFGVTLNGVHYTLPAPVSEFMANGWTLENLEDETLEAGDIASCTIKNGSQVIYQVYLANLSSEIKPWRECSIALLSTNLYSDAKTGVTLVLDTGISLESTYNDVIAAYGQPINISNNENTGSRTLTYSDRTFSSIKFRFTEDDILSSIIVDNRETDSKSPVSNRKPPKIVRKYQTPDSLGNSWNNFCIRYAGDLYQLPAPVAAFVKNGWSIMDENKIIPPGETVMGVLRKGTETELFTSIHNYSAKDEPMKNCFVTMLKYQTIADGPVVPVELARGITMESNSAAIKAAYGAPDYGDTSDTAEIYIYGKDRYKLTIGVSKETKTVFYMELHYEPGNLLLP